MLVSTGKARSASRRAANFASSARAAATAAISSSSSLASLFAKAETRRSQSARDSTTSSAVIDFGFGNTTDIRSPLVYVAARTDQLDPQNLVYRVDREKDSIIADPRTEQIAARKAVAHHPF